MFFSNGQDSKNLLDSLDLLEKYLKSDINKINLDQNIKDKNLQRVQEKIISIAGFLQKERVEDLRVFGEMMLVCEKLSDGFTDDYITQKTTDEKVNYIAFSINEVVRKIDESLSSVTSVLKEYESNDYRSGIDEELFRGGRLRELLEGINKLQKGITSRVLQAYKIGITLEHQANILQGEVDHLSRSTEQQAAAVEETAAAVEEITSNISHNTENVIKMANYAKNLTDSANNGQTLATETTQSMNEIDEQVNSINEAITVIDQIAFQTNILSLNAAVEAATAGEAGKGFAVVAQEVRNLASRSAEAANEIKVIVENATQKANHGKKMADEMIEGYSILNENISQTITLISDIEHASREQLAGIEQINQSIQNIDRATQQNASSTQNVNNITAQTYNVANKLVNANKDVNFVGKEAVETPDEIIESIFTNKRIAN